MSNEPNDELYGDDAHVIIEPKPIKDIWVKCEFEYLHHSPLRENITVTVDAAGNIITATLYSRLLGCDVDVTLYVLSCESLKKEIYSDFNYRVREDKINELKE